LVGLFLVSAFLVFFLVFATAFAGENVGAGETRQWTGISGSHETTIKAEYVRTVNGIVTLNWTHTVKYQDVDRHVVRNGTTKFGYADVPTYDVHTKVHNRKKDVTDVLKVPMAKLSEVDRKWVEATDPDNTCLKKSQPKGVVGTLTPHFGSYRLEKKIDGDNAVVSYVNEGKTQWTFLLHSTLVPGLEVGKAYHSIPEASTTSANTKRGAKKDVPADFKRAGQKTVDGEMLPVIEDN